MAKYFPLFILALSFQLSAFSQENSPYSRYGIGDMAPDQNILSRGMGGIAIGYATSVKIADATHPQGYRNSQNINFKNPASYSALDYTIFDIAAEVDSRKLKSINPTASFKSNYAMIPYMQVGLPIKMKKANKDSVFLGITFGIKQVSRINYKIAKFERLPGIDSLVTFYEGSGGINEASVGAGLAIKNFSIGFNAGYMFGNKDYSTQLTFLNDTVSYYESVSSTKTHVSGLALDAGVQYTIKLKKNQVLRLGGYGSLKQNLSANKDVLRETVVFGADGESSRVDSVYANNVKGTLVYPASYGFGATLQQPNWLVGADFEMTNWNQYRFYDEKDFVQNNWKVRLGAEYFPAKATTSVKKYFNFVRYRAGFYYGPNSVKLTNTVPEYAFTFGAGFPLKLRRSFYETQSSVLNTAIEIGSRGNNQSNLKENFFRISFGLSLADIWFRRAKYD